MFSGETREDVRTSRRTRRPHPQECAIRGPNPTATEVDDLAFWVTPIRVAAITLLAFLPVIAGGWVNWDDDSNFLANDGFRGLGWSQIAWAWKTTLLGVYQPLGWMLLEAQYCLWGMDPRGYHIVSLGLQGAIAVVLFLVAQTLIRRALPEQARLYPVGLRRASALAAVLFAIHPIRTEAVAWLSCQTYLVSYLLVLLTTLAYLKAHENGRIARETRLWMTVALGLYVLALLSKVVAVTLPAVFLILDVYPLKRLGRGRGLNGWLGARERWALLEKIPFFALSLVFSVIAMHSRLVFDVSLGNRIVIAGYAFWFYFVKTLVPTGLCVLYLAPRPVQPSDPFYLGCVLGVIVATAVVIWNSRRWPALTAAWMAYAVVLLPNSGLFAIVSGVAADRYCYIPSMGFFILVGGLWFRWTSALKSSQAQVFRAGRVLVPLAGVGLIGSLCVLSWFQSATWHNSEMLWIQAIEHGAEESMIAQNNLAQALVDQGRLPEAVPHFERAVQIRPEMAKVHANLGRTLVQLGRTDEAITSLREALRLAPLLLQAQRDMGEAMLRKGRVDDAERYLREALRLDPDYAEAHYSLGNTLLIRNQRDEALAHFQQAVRLRPGYAAAERRLKALQSEAATPGPTPPSSARAG